jgi:type II restriction enzyme
MSKISMMNEFYKLNRTYVFKKDGSSDRNHYSPVSMYFKEDEWSEDDMYNILKEIGETALRYYIF